MLALRLLLVLPILVYSRRGSYQHVYLGSPYQAGPWTQREEKELKSKEDMTIGELEQMAEDQEAKRVERLKKEFEKREEMKRKVDEMVLEGFKTLVNDYKVYSAIGSNKNMTLGEYRAALKEFNKKYPGKILYFENLRNDIKRKLAKEAYEGKEDGTKTTKN